MIYLRPATNDDKDFFLEQRNEPVAARMSCRGPITKKEHDHYWAYTTDIRLVITNNAHERIGLIRVQMDGTVSIIIIPTARGLHIGSNALRLLPFHLATVKNAPPKLYAEILPENEASQTAFKNAGWHPILFTREVAGV